MKAPNFLLHRLKTQLAMHGVEYTFSRNAVDKFGQPLDDVKEEIKLNGIYHESNSYIQTTGADATVMRTTKSPMILCLYEDSQKIKQDDVVVIAGSKYKVSGILNIQDYSIAADISLEEVI